MELVNIYYFGQAMITIPLRLIFSVQSVCCLVFFIFPQCNMGLLDLNTKLNILYLIRKWYSADDYETRVKTRPIISLQPLEVDVHTVYFVYNDILFPHS